ncbi:Ig-like domain-containing protein, partial [Corynebacterium sp. LK2510]|uniref:Ig-like domain-containing protein n=1 Tax=Corynebacterium sp. LK2510 TaxID=3110472 RepID=UPI0034CD1F43
FQRSVQTPRSLMFNHSGLRSWSRPWIAVLTALAMVLVTVGIQSPPKANAAEVQPTGIQFSLTDPDRNPVTELNETTPYIFSFEFQVPDGTSPGDQFTVTLPESFSVVERNLASLGDGAIATVDGNVVTVTFGEGIGGQIDIRGGLEVVAKYNHSGPDGGDVDVSVTVGKQSVYEKILKGSGPPPNPPMTINKWSGWEVDGKNFGTLENLKIHRADHNYQWIKPAEGQVFAHWFIELNNWQGNNPPEVIGQNVIVTDKLAGLPAGFSPAVVPAVEGALNQQQLDAQLEGSYLRNFFSVAVRDEGKVVPYPELGNQGETANFITFERDSFTFRVSDYLQSIGVNPSDKAQYAINYYSLVPAVSANISNSATVTSDEFTTPGTDVGWYKSVDTIGWIDRKSPVTTLTVNKVWCDVNKVCSDMDPGVAPDLSVEFELLANGQPAKLSDGTLAPKLMIKPGETSVMWSDLPTQSYPLVPIVYTVKEGPVAGFTSKVSGPFTPDLTNPSKIPNGAITVTNTGAPISTTTPSSETSTTTPSSETSTTTPATTTPSSETSTTTPATVTTTLNAIPPRPSADPSTSTTSTPTGPNKVPPGPTVGPMTSTVKPTPSPAASQPKAQQTSAPASQQKSAQPQQRTLANTGANTTTIALVALVMLVIGGSMIIVRRRAQ